MAIRDLLWACPCCGREGALQPTRGAARGAEVCQGCATSFSRGKGAAIVAWRPGHPPLVLSPAEWLDRLPGLDLEGGDVVRREPATLRTETGSMPVSFRGTYLNRIERLGPPRRGVLELHPRKVVFHPAADPKDATEPVTWDFDEITAVQPSSSTLQLSARGMPLAALQVPGGSIRFWEELICTALRHHYHSTGRGEIIEFQPRIATRPAP